MDATTRPPRTFAVSPPQTSLAQVHDQPPPRIHDPSKAQWYLWLTRRFAHQRMREERPQRIGTRHA